MERPKLMCMGQSSSFFGTHLGIGSFRGVDIAPPVVTLSPTVSAFLIAAEHGAKLQLVKVEQVEECPWLEIQLKLMYLPKSPVEEFSLNRILAVSAIPVSPSFRGVVPSTLVFVCRKSGICTNAGSPDFPGYITNSIPFSFSADPNAVPETESLVNFCIEERSGATAASGFCCAVANSSGLISVWKLLARPVDDGEELAVVRQVILEKRRLSISGVVARKKLRAAHKEVFRMIRVGEKDSSESEILLMFSRGDAVGVCWLCPGQVQVEKDEDVQNCFASLSVGFHVTKMEFLSVVVHKSETETGEMEGEETEREPAVRRTATFVCFGDGQCVLVGFDRRRGGAIEGRVERAGPEELADGCEVLNACYDPELNVLLLAVAHEDRLRIMSLNDFSCFPVFRRRPLPISQGNDRHCIRFQFGEGLVPAIAADDTKYFLFPKRFGTKKPGSKRWSYVLKYDFVSVVPYCRPLPRIDSVHLSTPICESPMTPLTPIVAMWLDKSLMERKKVTLERFESLDCGDLAAYLRLFERVREEDASEFFSEVHGEPYLYVENSTQVALVTEYLVQPNYSSEDRRLAWRVVCMHRMAVVLERLHRLGFVHRSIQLSRFCCHPEAYSRNLGFLTPMQSSELQMTHNSKFDDLKLCGFRTCISIAEAADMTSADLPNRTAELGEELLPRLQVVNADEEFLPPEVYSNFEYSTSSDVYSLGLCFAVLIYGISLPEFGDDIELVYVQDRVEAYVRSMSNAFSDPAVLGMIEMIRKMLLLEPQSRIPLGEVIECLRSMDVGDILVPRTTQASWGQNYSETEPEEDHSLTPFLLNDFLNDF